LKKILRSASVDSLGVNTISSTESRRVERKEYLRRKFVMSISLLCLRRGFFGMANLKRRNRVTRKEVIRNEGKENGI
jgi:hypothetical protein